MTNWELIQTLKEYAKEAIADYRESAQDDIDSGNERRAMYWIGIVHGLEEAINILEDANEEM